MGGGLGGILAKTGLITLMILLVSLSMYAAWRVGVQHGEETQTVFTRTAALAVEATTAKPPVVITEGVECATCHGEYVLKAATGVHANIACAACHEGIPEHMASPLDPAYEPEVWFSKQNCGSCHTGRWIETIREINIVKSVPMEIPVNLTDWKNVEELEAFLSKDDTDKTIFLTANAQGKVELNNQCEEAAFQLRNRAQTKGKYISIIALSPDEFYKWYGQRVASNAYHAICMARINNEFWYIEPSNDKHWVGLYLEPPQSPFTYHTPGTSRYFTRRA